MIGSVLNRFAVLGIMLAAPAISLAQATQTRLSAETHDNAGRTRANISVAVEPQDAAVPSGTIVLKDGRQTLSGAALNADGKAVLALDLAPGAHNLKAVYSGDATHRASVSDVSVVNAATAATPDFTVSVAPATLFLTAGVSGNLIASVNPVNTSADTPMFVTLACAGMPDQSACTFTPQTVEILPGATAAVNSSVVVSTQSKNSPGAMLLQPNANHVSWAVLLPGTLVFAGLAFSVRRRRWLSRFSMVALVGFVGVLGLAGCAPRYNYFHHGPSANLPTPPGTYTIQITAQSSDGVTAITHAASFAFTVK